MKYRKYILVKFANFVYICIARGKVAIFAAILAQKWQLFPRVIQIYSKFTNLKRAIFSVFYISPLNFPILLILKYSF